ncbi:MAG: DUF4389 domain-containing protein [Gammaproteobacteria bacterium]|nr:DUF4389 domain-containing protein [Gammaproteobacteria bacterium]
MADDMDQIVDNLKQSSSWIRVLFMLGYAILLYVIVAPVIIVLMIVQALFVLITGTYNSNLKYLGAALAQYVQQIFLFISYNSELKPFPFADFPGFDAEPAAAGESETGAWVDAVAGKKSTKPKTVGKKKPSEHNTSHRKAAHDNKDDGDGGAIID